MGLADRDYMKDLYALLGVSPQMPADQLRYSYEQAVGAATRSGDLVRARVLLAAFEALPGERRRAMVGRRSVPAALGSVRTTRRPPQRRRSRRQRKWGMSFLIRMLFLFIVVPAAAIAFIGSIASSWHGTTESVGQQTQGYIGAAPQNVGLSASDVALYVERLDERDDVSCTPATVTAFECHASDGTLWSVRGTSMNNLVASVIAPSMYSNSARFDAQAAVSAIKSCRRMQGQMPSSFQALSTPARFSCGGGVETLYLRPGDSLMYTRENAHSYGLSVTAGDGETVTYNSRTKAYSPG
jgi:hypothetical protein